MSYFLSHRAQYYGVKLLKGYLNKSHHVQPMLKIQSLSPETYAYRGLKYLTTFNYTICSRMWMWCCHVTVFVLLSLNHYIDYWLIMVIEKVSGSDWGRGVVGLGTVQWHTVKIIYFNWKCSMSKLICNIDLPLRVSDSSTFTN